MTIIKLLRYIIRKLYIIVIVLALCVLAGLFAYDNIYITTTARDGMTERAECILKKADTYNMYYLFTNNYMYNKYDEEAAVYEEYQADYYIQSLDVHMVLVWPWSTECKVTVEERIIDMSGDYIGYNESLSEDYTPPEWVAGEYELTLRKTNGVWKIDNIELKEELPPLEE